MSNSASESLSNYLITGQFPAAYDYRQQELGAPANFLADWLQLSGPAYVISTACTSSGRALLSARRLLELGVCDAVICGVVQAVKQCLPTTGVVGRVGGEEFTVLLTDADYAQAYIVAEQMRAAIASWDFKLPTPQQVTASFGVSWTPQGANFSAAYGAADEALYNAKHNGRNRVTRADKLPPAN